MSSDRALSGCEDAALLQLEPRHLQATINPCICRRTSLSCKDAQDVKSGNKARGSERRDGQPLVELPEVTCQGPTTPHHQHRHYIDIDIDEYDRYSDDWMKNYHGLTG